MNGAVGGLLFTALVILAVVWLAVVYGRRQPKGYRPVPLPVQARPPRPDVPWCVYFIPFIDADPGYIGKAEDDEVRLKRHEKDQAVLPAGHRRNWWHRVTPEVRATYHAPRVIWYANRAAAEKAERAFIRQYDPPGNVIKYRTPDREVA